MWTWWTFFSYYELTGAAKCLDGSCTVGFPFLWGAIPADLTKPPNYHVLGTDYINYSIVYSCGDTWYGKLEAVWILYRRPTIDQAILDNLRTAIKGIPALKDYDHKWSGVKTW